MPLNINQGRLKISMTTNIISDPYSSSSLFKTVARGVLTVLSHILPKRMYYAIYQPLFQGYQWFLRNRYKAGISSARRQGNHALVQRCERVLSVMPHSLIGSQGLEHTHDLALDLVENRVAGAFVECGVAQGGCAALIAMVADSDSANRHCWFFDSFEGLPDPTSDDFEEGRTGRHIRPLPKGSCLGTLEQVSELLFETFGFSRERITLVKGWFQDTVENHAPQMGSIALLRIDGDWYDSTMCCLEALYDRVSPGGHVIIDDYFSCYGAKKATDEFLQRRGGEVRLVSDGRGGCSFQKPASHATQQTEPLLAAA